jgi:hypothetical protein
MHPLFLLALGLVLIAFLNLFTALIPSAHELRAIQRGNVERARTLVEERERRAALEDRNDAVRNDPFVIEQELRRAYCLVRPDETVVLPAEGEGAGDT